MCAQARGVVYKCAEKVSFAGLKIGKVRLGSIDVEPLG